MSVLRQLYRGEIFPLEYDAPQHEEYKQAMQRLLEISSALSNTMTEEQKALLEDYEFASAVVEDLEQEELFCQGFILGVQILRATEKLN